MPEGYSRGFRVVSSWWRPALLREHFIQLSADRDEKVFCCSFRFFSARRAVTYYYFFFFQLFMFEKGPGRTTRVKKYYSNESALGFRRYFTRFINEDFAVFRVKTSVLGKNRYECD